MSIPQDAELKPGTIIYTASYRPKTDHREASIKIWKYEVTRVTPSYIWTHAGIFQPNRHNRESILRDYSLSADDAKQALLPVYQQVLQYAEEEAARAQKQVERRREELTSIIELLGAENLL